jgi:hypothetical protein
MVPACRWTRFRSWSRPSRPRSTPGWRRGGGMKRRGLLVGVPWTKATLEERVHVRALPVPIVPMTGGWRCAARRAHGRLLSAGVSCKTEGTPWTLSAKSNHARNGDWTPPFSSSMRSFTSSCTGAKRANVRSNRTGKAVPTAGYGWPRTARAAVTRCRRPVRRPAPGVAWQYHRARHEGCLVPAVGGVLHVEIRHLSKLTSLCFKRGKLSRFRRHLHIEHTTPDLCAPMVFFPQPER